MTECQTARQTDSMTDWLVSHRHFLISTFFLKVYLRSYLRIQRDQYLQQQLALEQKASEIILHTTTVTNALSPDEYFELISRDAIEDMFMKDSFGN